MCVKDSWTKHYRDADMPHDRYANPGKWGQEKEEHEKALEELEKQAVCG